MGSGVVLTEAEREALASQFHEHLAPKCLHAELIDPQCEQWADAVTPSVERIVAARVERALAEQREGIAETIEDHSEAFCPVGRRVLLVTSQVARSYRLDPTDG